VNIFTELHVAQIIQYLGYSLDDGDRSVVVQQLNRVEDLGSAYADSVVDLLRELDELQKDIYQATPFASRSFQSSPSSTAQHFRGDRLRLPMGQAKQIVQRLSNLLHLPVRNNAFSSGSGSWIHR